jgi:hypothetical protein
MPSNIFPGAVDTWGDGIDSDCWHGDSPACGVLESGSDFPRQASTQPGCATGSDLQLSVSICGGGYGSAGSLWGFVGNSGPEAFAGAVAISWRDNQDGSGSLAVSSSPIGAGGASSLFEVPFKSNTELRITIEAEDCEANNNSFVYSNPFSPCAR